MLYLVGLGLSSDGLSKESLEILKKCKRIYLETYTVEFSYAKQHLEELIGKKILDADRTFVENLEFLDESQKMDVALLIYGDPLVATTHITIVDEAKKSGIKLRVIHNASILDAVSDTGLQIYKFGKTASMPKWDAKKNFTPESFMEIVKENQSINAHTLILVDIGLEFRKALEQLKTSAKNQDLQLGKILACQQLGSKHQRIIYETILQLEEQGKIHAPFCFIIPGKLHFVEKEFLKNFEGELL